MDVLVDYVILLILFRYQFSLVGQGVVNMAGENEKKLLVKHLAHPDEVRDLPKTKIETVNIIGRKIIRVTYQPGWKWSECIKSIADTDSCEVPHSNYVISGQMKIMMDDGTVKIIRAGDVAVIPPGHNAEVIGDEPCVILDIVGGEWYGKRKR